MHIYSRRLVSGAGAGAVRGVSRRLLSTIPAVMYIPGSMPDNTLYIIDGTSLLFTTWFAKEHSQSKTILTTRNGVDCRAIAHMVGRLCYFMGTVRPKYVALVFDSKNVIKRDIYPEYKATRKGVSSHVFTVSIALFSLDCVMSLCVCLCRKTPPYWRSYPWRSLSSRGSVFLASALRGMRRTM